MHWVSTRKLHIFILFLAFSVAAGYCFVQAYLTNPYLPKLTSEKPTSYQWKLGQEEFILPNYLHAGTINRMALWCNVSGYNLVVGTPTSVVVVVEISTDIYNILTVEVTVRNALKCLPIAYENFPLMEPLTPSRFSLYLEGIDRSTFFPFKSQVYGGGDWVEFQAAGAVELMITISLLPSWNMSNIESSWEDFNSMFPDNRCTLDVVLPSVVIESGSVAK